MSPSVSADGRYVAFMSVATNLVVANTYDYNQIYLYDRQSSTTTLVSTSSDGTGGNNHCFSPQISGDGRYVVFHSKANNLVSGDTNNMFDVFLADTYLGIISLVSKNADGIPGNSDSRNAFITPDGRYIAFQSAASNLVSGDTNAVTDVFLYDTAAALLIRCSQTSGGQGGNGESRLPSVSGDGRYVVYESLASNLIPNDSNGKSDILLYDTLLQTTELISVNANGEVGNGNSYWPDITPDGRYVAFHSRANLSLADLNGVNDIYVRDRQTSQTILASIGFGGAQANADCNNARVLYSGSSLLVAFGSSASNLVAGDTNNFMDVFIRDVSNSQTTRISVNSDGIQGNSHSDRPAFSSNGSMVSFQSWADNLVPADTNGFCDVFITPLVDGADTTPPTVPLVTVGSLFAGQRQNAVFWSSSDPESGIVEYWYAVGTSPTDTGSGYVVSWRSAGLNTSVLDTYLPVVDDVRYYWYVKAKNGEGLWSQVGVSRPVYCFTSFDTTPAMAKLKPDGVLAALLNVVVSSGSGQLPGRVYIQDINRSSGLALSSSTGSFQVGDLVEAVGTLATISGERIVTNVEILKRGTAPAPRPLQIRLADSFASDFFWSHETGAGQRGTVSIGRGSLSNIGLLVTACARFNGYSSNDGLLTDGSLRSGWPSPFLDAAYLENPLQGDLLGTTGILSLKQVGNEYYPYLRPRSQQDIIFLFRSN